MVNKAQEFSNNTDIDQFFSTFGSSNFVDWFNTYISKDESWQNNGGQPIRITKQLNWQKVWANLNILFNKPTANLIEYLCINSIIINETGGTFFPVTESVSSAGHPGIAYAFDKTKSKRSYNTLDTNKTALHLFNDPVYISEHGHKPFGNLLKNTTDNRWSGESFPVGFSGNPSNETATSGKTNTFLTEADFMKFRGRGFIQTTGRENYKQIIKFVQKYSGNDSIILTIKKAWSKYSNVDDIASISTNQQWDDLFQNSNNIIPNYACYGHSILPSRYKNYNIINPNQSDAALQKSIRNVGLAVGGNSGDYADTFLERILIQLKILDNNTTNAIAATNNTAPIEQTPGRLATTGQDPTTQVVASQNLNVSSNITNLFKPTIKAEPITFKI